MKFSALELAAVGAALAYFAFLAIERALLSFARSGLEAVVHVNGTRGKSETTRLIAAAMRDAGVPTLAKTTGTEARLILPDGTERRLARLGAPNVREQRNLLFLARRMGARCVVAECMAVEADAQAASTAFLRPDILVVTNSRPDHQGALGDPDRAAEVFAAGLSPGGKVVTAESGLMPLLERVAAERGGRALLAPPLAVEGITAIPENLGLALLVSSLLGAERGPALEGMRRHRADPGAFAVRRLAARDGGTVIVLDALAANDTVSTERLLEAYGEGGTEDRGVWLLIAARPDRPERNAAFAAWAALAGGRYRGVIIAGRIPARARRRIEAPVERIRRGAAIARLAALPGGSVVHAVGNWRRLGPALAAAAPAIRGPGPAFGREAP
jgi:gamma-polyglutamate synthase